MIDPNGECVFNVSKETTVKEIISIDGVDEFTQRAMGVNLSSGATNAVEICCNLFKLPTLVDLLTAFEQDLKMQGSSSQSQQQTFEHVI